MSDKISTAITRLVHAKFVEVKWDAELGSHHRDTGYNDFKRDIKIVRDKVWQSWQATRKKVFHIRVRKLSLTNVTVFIFMAEAGGASRQEQSFEVKIANPDCADIIFEQAVLFISEEVNKQPESW